MSDELEQAIKLANIVLDRRNGDPDDDFAVLSRQLLRSVELNRKLLAGVTGAPNPDDYFIDFDTQIEPGKLVAVRVRLDQMTITEMDKPLKINLCEHPLYKELARYVKANHE